MLAEPITPLRDQVPQQFAEGVTLGRGDLRLDADYGSVGRALNRLVGDRKIVRFGRGRYRRAGFGASSASASISDLMECKIARSKRNVFLRSDFAGLGSYDAVGRALRRLVVARRLVQIGYGLYAKAGRSRLTGKAAPLVGIRRLASGAIARLGKSAAPSSFDTEYNSGRSTQVLTGRAIAVKGRVRRRIGFGGTDVVLERAR